MVGVQLCSGQVWPGAWAMVVLARLAGLLVALGLSACGGGGGGAASVVPVTPSTPGNEPVAAECTLDAQKGWLRSYFDEWYLWRASAPTPEPAAFASVADLFNASLVPLGNAAGLPRDRWSNITSSASFNLLFGEGRSLGYGISVAGTEVTGQPTMPLFVRYVEALSDGFAQGVRRGDQVLSINGRAAADIVRTGDFSALTATAEGQQITLQLQREGVQRTATVTAGTYTLTPLGASGVVSAPLGRRLGYLHVLNMISPVEAPVRAAANELRLQGVQDLVLDLRYNGGGLVSTGAQVASVVSAATTAGQVYASLVFSDRRAASNNQQVRFATGNSSALTLPRVFVLAGPRTCSASEQVINGLRGVGVQVVLIGSSTCGKPVGFNPPDRCGSTYNVVSFESLNARGEGRYYDGFTPTCAVAEDFRQPLGAASEPLLAAAAHYAERGTCPPAATGADAAAAQALQRRSGQAGVARDGEGAAGMWAR
jgi:carboxyl-terminal processing protease